jgi:PD-(D/E)XK nuclease superfamily
MPQMHAEHADELRTNELSERIIGCAFRVLNTLGAGFLEKVYENAMAHEMRRAGVSVRGIVVGEYVADLVVEDSYHDLLTRTYDECGKLRELWFGFS